VRRSDRGTERGVIAARSYAIGERRPAEIIEASTEADVARVLAAATQRGAAVVAFGGETLQSIGNPPARFDVALAMHRMNRVVAYEPRDLTIGVEAGTTLAELARTLAAARQFVPFDAPHPERATVGGTLAAGWAGPRRGMYGRARDLVIGTTAALADGTLAHAGGMVVKNVTGYDMSKLSIGALGTLGIIVRANLKTLPLPAAERLAIAPLADDTRDRAIAALATLAIEPAAALVIHGFATALPPRMHADDARLVVAFAGSAAVVDRATRDLRSALGAAGVAETLLLDGAAAERAFQATIDAYVDVAGASLTYRATGRPTDAWPRAQAFHALAASHGVRTETIVDLLNGDVVLRVSARTHAAIAEALGALDAAIRAIAPSAHVLAGDARLRAAVDAWGRPPATLATMRMLKDRFDPQRTLAPGRHVGGI
jgi:glycolate oxidase FAD binding subunit